LINTKRLEKIYKLKKHPDNPRVIKDVKFKKLVKSIQEFPEMLEIRPIVVNKDLVVLGGNMRLKAAQEAGLKDIWIDQADWSEEKQREFIIKDNSSYGEWDWDELANSWDVDNLNDWALDLPPMFDEPEQDLNDEDKTKTCKICGKDI
jgi:ParB-like chromosome segregation protein Spo0J